MDEKITASKLLVSNNEDLKKEIKTLKKTIKAQQNAYEKLRTEHTDLDRTYSILDNSTRFDLVFEISKIVIAILVGFFTNLLASDTKNGYLRFINIFLVMLYVWIVIYQWIKNKKK